MNSRCLGLLDTQEKHILSSSYILTVKTLNKVGKKYGSLPELAGERRGVSDATKQSMAQVSIFSVVEKPARLSD
jgi:hypothetical protein